MAWNRAVCRVRVRNPPDHPTGTYALNARLKISNEIRSQWAQGIVKAYHSSTSSQELKAIRDLDFVLTLDGAVEHTISDSSTLESVQHESSILQQRRYSGHFQLPETVLGRIKDDQEKIRRMELFAVGSLLYEIATSHKPFHELDEAEVQTLFGKGVFPKDVWALPTAAGILCYWLPEFSAELQVPLNIRLQEYIKQHPALFSFQVLGGIASVAALVAVPILGFIGFSALGPVAGSAAAGWQAGIGLVEAGSLFAWCQSAAMGGAAIGSIVATGVSGLTVAVGATALQALESPSSKIPPNVLERKFLDAWQKHNFEG